MYDASMKCLLPITTHYLGTFSLNATVRLTNVGLSVGWSRKSMRASVKAKANVVMQDQAVGRLTRALNALY